MSRRRVDERLFLRLPNDPPCTPETTVPRCTLGEFAVPGALRSTVKHVTAYEESFAPGVEVSERVLPDGASRLLVLFQEGTASVRIAGASASPVVLTMRGHVQGLSLTLGPGATLTLFGVPAHELAGRTVAWEDVARPSHRTLPEQLAEAATAARCTDLIFRSLRELRRPFGMDAHRRLEQLTAAPAGMVVRALAAEMGLSERRLQQLFAEHIGLTPVTWRRLQRLHATLRILRTAESAPWVDVALRGGYYDQSHLINEFRALCGLTPKEFVRRRVSESSNTAARQRG